MRVRAHGVAALGLSIVLLTSAASGSHAARQQQTSAVASQHGLASWYGKRFQGRRTANGERFDMHRKTAAHRTLPFGTRVRVTNVGNGRQTIVRINDRGPYVKGRIIDISYAAADQIEMVHAGVAKVHLEVLGRH